MSRLREFICHGKEERCLTVFGQKLPICSRCTGFYSGILIGFISKPLFSNFDVEFLFIFSLIGLIPLGIDGIFQEVTDHESSNVIRLSTGLFCGLFIGMDIYWIFFLS